MCIQPAGINTGENTSDSDELRIYIIIQDDTLRHPGCFPVGIGYSYDRVRDVVWVDRLRWFPEILIEDGDGRAVDMPQAERIEVSA